MKKIIFTLFVLISMSANGSAFAQRSDSDVGLSEIQSAMMDHMSLIGRSDLANQLQDLDLATWQVLYDSMPTKVVYVNAVESMRQHAAASKNNLKSSLSSPSPVAASRASVVAPMFTPAYPTGADYNAYTATLPGLQLLFDTPDIGTEAGTSLVDERCDGNGEGGLRIATHVLIYATKAADVGCSAGGTVFCIPYGIASPLSYASEIVLEQCGYQTALVDSAEIEAAYENTAAIITTVNDIDTVINDETNFTSDTDLAVLKNQLSAHDTDIKTNLNTHDTKINTNLDTHNTTINNNLNVQAADIKNNLNIHDTSIKNNLSIHDTDIKDQLNTHDTEIKAQLTALQGSVDVLLSRQLEVIRLLHTPQGKRKTDVPACNGGSCDFPEK